MTRALRAARLATLVLGGLVSVAPAWAGPVPPPRLRDFRAAEGQISFLQPDNSRTILELATGTVIQRQAGPRGSWPRAPQCDTERADRCPFPDVEVRLDSYLQPALPTHFDVRAETGRWEADYEPLPPNPRHLVLRAVGESLLVEDAAPHGVSHLECVDRRNGQSRWVYLYAAPRFMPSDPRLSSLGVQDALRGMREDADYEEVNQYGGTVVRVKDGEPRPPRRRVVLDPDPGHRGAIKQAVAAGWFVLAAALVAAAAWGRSNLWPATYAVIVIAWIVLLAGNLDLTLLIAASIAFLTLTVLTARVASSAQRFVLVSTVLITIQLFLLPLFVDTLTRD